jgi:hypothetical protein
MMSKQTPASGEKRSTLAIHICSSTVTMGIRKCWQPSVASWDTTMRAVRICERLGIVEQQVLAGETATADSLLRGLLHARESISEDGLIVLTYSGHTERGDGPIETACWCLVDRAVQLSDIAHHLALLPGGVRLLIICDSCYGAAITRALVGTQQVVVIAGCAEDQTMVERRRSEFMVQLEKFVWSGADPSSLEELRAQLEADTPDCERPVVWSNAEHLRRLGAPEWTACEEPHTRSTHRLASHEEGGASLSPLRVETAPTK